jgi:predicted Zn-dependent peptidase
MNEVERVSRQFLENFKKEKSTAKRKRAGTYKPQESILKRTIKQAKCAIGRDAYPLHDERRIPLFLLVNILGGPGMNSRLNLALREKYGFVYSIDAHYIPYTDTGMFAVFFGTEPRQLEKCIALIKKELYRFCEKPLTSRQLASAKEQIKGQLAMAEENNLSLMLMMGRTLLDLGKIPALDEIYSTIDETSSLALLRIAQEIFDESTLSFLIMEPDKRVLSNGHGVLV